MNLGPFVLVRRASYDALVKANEAHKKNLQETVDAIQAAYDNAGAMIDKANSRSFQFKRQIEDMKSDMERLEQTALKNIGMARQIDRQRIDAIAEVDVLTNEIKRIRELVYLKYGEMIE